MAFQNILLEKNGAIATITVNREKQMNALNIATIQEIGQAVAQCNEDHDIAGMVLTGAGEKAFVAGADIKEFSAFSVEEGTKLSADGHAVFNSIEHSPKPVIAAINGFALGGGLELAMACHFRIASDNAKFGQPEVNLGVIPGYGGTQRLIRLIGHGKAMELLMTADMVDAETAQQLGLVNHVVAPEELYDLANKLMGKIAKKSPLTIKQIIDLGNAYHDPEADGFTQEIEQFGQCFGTADFAEGVDAFVNKRKAEFRGEWVGEIVGWWVSELVRWWFSGDSECIHRFNFEFRCLAERLFFQTSMATILVLGCEVTTMLKFT